MIYSKLLESKVTTSSIKSIKKFAWTIKVELKELQEVSACAETLYRPYYDKKEGKRPRLIHNPAQRLKIIQRKINTWILQKYPFPSFIVGGIKGKTLGDHLELHLKKDIVVTLDIKGCFDSITNKQVYDVFVTLGAHTDTAALATSLTTYKGLLPTGAPTSPLLANLVLLSLLVEVKEFVGRHGFDLSQFIDDSAFSGGHLPVELVSEVCKKMSRAGFTISHKKTKVMPSSRSQVVTKRIVNQRPGLLKKERNRIRSAINELNHTSKADPLYESRLASVKGRILSMKKLYSEKAQKLLQQIQ